MLRFDLNALLFFQKNIEIFFYFMNILFSSFKLTHSPDAFSEQLKLLLCEENLSRNEKNKTKWTTSTSTLTLLITFHFFFS
jgi:hypothetical protein